MWKSFADESRNYSCNWERGNTRSCLHMESVDEDSMMQSFCIATRPFTSFLQAFTLSVGKIPASIPKDDIQKRHKGRESRIVAAEQMRKHLGSRTDTTPAFHHHSLSVTAQPPPSLSFSASLEAFQRRDDSASFDSPPLPLSLGGSSLAVGPGELDLHPGLQLQGQ